MSAELLAGRLAVVTGATGGIGRALVHGLANVGARVVAAGRDPAKLRAMKDDMHALGVKIATEEVDVADAASCATFADAVAQLGQISILVNNAGVVAAEPIDSPDAGATWDRMLSVNMGGPFNMVRALREPLCATRGSVVNISSVAATVYTRTTVGYNASKGGVTSLTMALSRELGGSGVRVNAVAPGVIATEMSTSLKDPEKLKILENRVALNRIGKPEDIVGPVVFLASDMAAYVTGTTLVADGGYTTF